jgi:hypothetical protein
MLSFVLRSVIMLRVYIQSGNMPSVIMLIVTFIDVEFRYAKCHYTECCYPECHYAVCRFVECHDTMEKHI